MATVQDFILGNSTLYDRFFTTTEILARLVSSAPRGVSLAQLEEATGRSGKEVSKLCAGLTRANLVRPEPLASNKWMLACDPSLITLEDVFRCVMTGQRARPGSKSGASERAPNDVDLLVMQAMIAINQSVFMHLRQFSLDRLKISAAGMFPAPRRVFHDSSLDDAFDLAMTGREAKYGSPEQIAA